MSGLEVNKRFGRYVIDAIVGQGGMGSVYRAHDVILKRAVALKVLHADSSEDHERDARFLREARLLAAVRHPAVVNVFDYGSEEGTPYLAMEWLEGRSLAEVGQSLPLESRLDVLETIAEALAAAHAQGIVHRDVKPANIVLDGKNRPRLVDFGIAKRKATPLAGAGTVRDALSFVTNVAVVMGTPRYMSPEQAITSDVDARTDQFAWGVLAYELLGGRHPSELMVDPLQPFPFGASPALAGIAHDVSPDLCAVVDRAMNRAIALRFASMDELLTAFLAARTSVAVPPQAQASAGARVVPVVSATSMALGSGPTLLALPVASTMLDPTLASGGAPTEARPPRRTTLVVLLAALVVVPLAGAGLFFGVRRPPPREPPPTPPPVAASAAASLTPAPDLPTAAPPEPSARASSGAQSTPRPRASEARRPAPRPAASPTSIKKDDGPMGL